MPVLTQSRAVEWLTQHPQWGNSIRRMHRVILNPQDSTWELTSDRVQAWFK